MMMMMVKVTLLLLSLAMPMINAPDCTDDCTATRDQLFEASEKNNLGDFECELEEPNCLRCDEIQNAMTIVTRSAGSKTFGCLPCWQIRKSIIDVPQTTLDKCMECAEADKLIAAVIANSELAGLPVSNPLSCIHCDDHIKEIIADNYNGDNLQCLECEQAEMVLAAVVENREDLGCLKCSLVEAIYEATPDCKPKRNRCYLSGRVYGSDSYDNGGGTEYYGDDSKYFSEGQFYQSYDRSTYNMDYDGYYEEERECDYTTVNHYYEAMPTDAKNIPAPVPCTNTKSYEPEYNKVVSDYETMKQEYTDYKNRWPQSFRDSAGDAGDSAAKAETTDKTTETVGWVLIAVSGVLFLASIAFFFTGRSERKAAAQNRMAGHGVMA